MITSCTTQAGTRAPGCTARCPARAAVRSPACTPSRSPTAPAGPGRVGGPGRHQPRGRLRVHGDPGPGHPLSRRAVPGPLRGHPAGPVADPDPLRHQGRGERGPSRLPTRCCASRVVHLHVFVPASAMGPELRKRWLTYSGLAVAKPLAAAQAARAKLSRGQGSRGKRPGQLLKARRPGGSCWVRATAKISPPYRISATDSAQVLPVRGRPGPLLVPVRGLHPGHGDAGRPRAAWPAPAAAPRSPAPAATSARSGELAARRAAGLPRAARMCPLARCRPGARQSWSPGRPANAPGPGRPASRPRPGPARPRTPA